MKTYKKMYKELLIQYEKDSEKLVGIINGIRRDTIDDCFNALLDCEMEKNNKGWDMIQLQEAMDKIIELNHMVQ